MKFILGNIAHSAFEQNLYSRKKNINFTEYKIAGDEDARALMTERADGRRTLPQIFIDNEGIGGCDDLYTLENENKLDALFN